MFKVSATHVLETLETTGRRVAEDHTLVCTLEELPERLRRQAYEVELGRGDAWLCDPPIIDDFDPDDPDATAAAVVEAWSSLIQEVRASDAAAAATQDAAEREARAAAARFREDMTRWIAAEGTRRLRLALDRGYKIAGAYVRERVASELPAFWVDTARDAEWTARTNPSEKALVLEQEVLERVSAVGATYDVEIVWLTKPPKDYATTHSAVFRRQEAVVVRQWLGRYDLVRLVDPPKADDGIPF